MDESLNILLSPEERQREEKRERDLVQEYNQRRSDMQSVLATAEGRRILIQMLETTLSMPGQMLDANIESHATLVLERGLKSAGRTLMNWINEADSDALIQLQRERLENMPKEKNDGD